MDYRRSFSALVAVVSMAASIAQSPVCADTAGLVEVPTASEIPTQVDRPVTANVETTDVKDALQVLEDQGANKSLRSEKGILIAQACGSCGAELGAVAAVGSVSLSRKKDQSLLTDSLWGNLILEMAYQRDKEMAKLLKKMGYLNVGTMASISTIAAGTLAQGIISLGTLNPTAGHEDSYVPGTIGIVLSAATIVTFVARTYFGHKFQKHVHDRQMQLKESVEHVLAHMEQSNGTCSEARTQLSELIGERASNEWLQLWRSSHQLASVQKQSITMNTKISK